MLSAMAIIVLTVFLILFLILLIVVIVINRVMSRILLYLNIDTIDFLKIIERQEETGNGSVFRFLIGRFAQEAKLLAYRGFRLAEKSKRVSSDEDKELWAKVEVDFESIKENISHFYFFSMEINKEFFKKINDSEIVKKWEEYNKEVKVFNLLLDRVIFFKKLNIL